MGNIFYRAPMVAESVGKTHRGLVLMEFLQLIAPKRPQFKFVVPSASECYIYHGTMDITCKDTKSANYVGAIIVAGWSRRGGKGNRPTIEVVPAGRGRIGCRETVSLQSAAKRFLSECTVRSLETVVGQVAHHAANVVGKVRSSARYTILSNLRMALEQLADLELAVHIPALLRGEGTSGLALNHVPKIEVAATEMLELCKVFGAKNEHMACVVQSGEKYAVNHNTAFMEYTSDTLPPHISRAIGMLKIAGVPEKLLPGYGVLVSDGVYAVSIEEVVL